MMNAVNKKVVQQARRDFKAQFQTNSLAGKNRNQPYSGQDWRAREKPIEKAYKYDNSKYEYFTSFVSNRTFYSRFLEYGAEILPRGKKYLTFVINGEFKKVKSVHLAARPILQPAVRSVWGSAEANTLMDEALQKALDRYWQKASAK